MIVVDTNIISYLYLTGEHSGKSEDLLEFDANWTAPVLWRSEFRNVLAQYLRTDELKMADVLQIIQQAEILLSGGEFEISSLEVMGLVEHSQCSAYDCEFVALASHLGVPLITTDKKILRDFPKVAKSVDAHQGN